MVCKAKNPATCRYHSSFQVKEPVNASQLFDEAMQRNVRVQSLNAHIDWSKEKFSGLKAKYEFSSPPITAANVGLQFGDDRLADYNNRYKELEAKATEEELQALHQYTGISFDPVNEYLRRPKEYRARFKEETSYLAAVDRLDSHIANLDNFIQKAGYSDEPFTVYRVISQDMTKRFVSGEEYAEANGLGEGQEIAFDSFSSTTIDPSFIHRWIGNEGQEHTDIVFVISTHKGAPVSLTATSPQENIYTQDTEREILLPRNSKYRVTQVTRERFASRDKNSIAVEPVTVHLEEIDN